MRECHENAVQDGKEESSMLPALRFLALALLFHVVAMDWWVDPEYLWTFRNGAELPENVIYSSSVLMITHAGYLTRFQGLLLGLWVPGVFLVVAFFFVCFGESRRNGRAPAEPTAVAPPSEERSG
jgi:hypothetical protein